MASEIEPTQAEPYSEGAVLTDVVGDHPKARILAALLGDHERDLNPSDISRLAGIDRTTFYAHIDDLQAYDLVEQTRTVGNSTMYQLNKENEAAQTLAAFEWALVEFLAETEQAEGLDEQGWPVMADDE